jgi:hypothetical protein
MPKKKPKKGDTPEPLTPEVVETKALATTVVEEKPRELSLPEKLAASYAIERFANLNHLGATLVEFELENPSDRKLTIRGVSLVVGRHRLRCLNADETGIVIPSGEFRRMSFLFDGQAAGAVAFLELQIVGGFTAKLPVNVRGAVSVEE